MYRSIRLVIRLILLLVHDKQMKVMCMMKGNNFYVMMLYAVLAVVSMMACSDDCLSGDDFSEGYPPEEGLVAAVKLESNGKVLSRSTFQDGTAYRLVMFTRTFDSVDNLPETSDSVCRYNGLATETALGTGTFQYLKVEDPSHDNNDWFGFKSLVNGETGRRSISFYGFTYGEEETAPNLDEIAYTQTETVDDETGKLKDLMWGILVDQNDATAKFPCEIPFRHAFSLLEFKVSQLASEDNSEAVSKAGMYKLGIESIAVTGTYKKGTVDLFTGKTKLDVGEKYDENGRTLPDMFVEYDVEKKEYIAVEKPDSLGAMIVFPSASESLHGEVGGYTIGLKITLKGGTKEEVEKLVGTGNATQSGNYYTGVYTVDKVYSSVYDGDNLINDGSIEALPLYLQSGSKYTLHIVLMKDEVRVVTIVPSKVEWMPGEEDGQGNTFSPEVIGQPIFFDNTMWMDRNLGANEADPGGDYNQTIGYYYQNNRNIPYWPYRTDYYGFWGTKKLPTPEARFDSANDLSKIFSSWDSPRYRVYPVIDTDAMDADEYRYSWYVTNLNITYLTTLQKSTEYTGTYIFFAGNGNTPWTGNKWGGADSGVDYRKNQPAPPGYALPTQEQFQSIFPTTVFAGNITFLQLRYDGNDWYGCVDNNNNMPLPINSDITKLRICVPFYKDGNNEALQNTEYYKHWRNLNDPGQYPSDPTIYYNGRSPYYYSYNEKKEPDGDPSSGFCSVYIISRDEGDTESITSSNYNTRQWGTIYGIKKVGTTESYRMRWKVRNADNEGVDPRLYVEVCMYSCTKDDNLTVDNFKNYDWEHPVSQMFFPLCGEVEGRNSGSGPAAGFSSYGSAVLYATDSDAALHIKITGDNPQNQYMSVVNKEVQTNAKQIRLVKTQN